MPWHDASGLVVCSDSRQSKSLGDAKSGRKHEFEWKQLCNFWEQFWVETGSLAGAFSDMIADRRQCQANASPEVIQTQWGIQVNVKNLDQSNVHQSDHIEKHVETEAWWRKQASFTSVAFKIWSILLGLLECGDMWWCLAPVRSFGCAKPFHCWHSHDFLSTPTSSWSKVRCSSGSWASPWFTPNEKQRWLAIKVNTPS